MELLVPDSSCILNFIDIRGRLNRDAAALGWST